MTKITLLKEGKDNHYQVMYNDDGPFSIGSTLDIKPEIVIKKIQMNNPHAEVVMEKSE